MRSRLFISVIISFLAADADAQQKEFETREQVWMAYFNQTRLTRRSGIWVDLHARLTNQFIREPAVAIARAGYIFYLKDNVRLSVGYAHVTQYSSITVDIPEHRPWQQIQWIDSRTGFSMTQYVRVEERYRRKTLAGELADGYDFNYRFRYNMMFTIPLKGKQVAPGVPFLLLSDEIMINAGKAIVNNYFDQNRLFAGIGYQFTRRLNAHFGYLRVFQQLPQGNKYVHVHALRLFVFHNIDLRQDD